MKGIPRRKFFQNKRAADAKQNKTKQNKTKQNKIKENKTNKAYYSREKRISES
jgi:hypothetical protein